MRLYIAGICGTFMAGLARLGQELGHTVGGCDAAAWPPMSDQLECMHIEMDQGWEHARLNENWDQIIIGNVLSRGNPLVETVLDKRLPFISGPQWLYEQVLKNRKVLAVAGTHGKTTTTSMLAWILHQAGTKPGFLLGGQALDFPESAQLGCATSPFVIEADEYDSAFFDKRPKFLHYHPHIALLNNLEFDHADIYANLEAIQLQFHYFLRTVPSNGQVLYRAGDKALQAVVDQGVWASTETFAIGGALDGGAFDAAAPDYADWVACPVENSNTHFAVYYQGEKRGVCHWNIPGQHNTENALGAIAAAYHTQVEIQTALHALESFQGVCRRLEMKAQSEGITVYDDFAHHPTAIAASLQTVRESAQSQGRVIAVFEPASNSMKLGVHCQNLAQAFAQADEVFCYQSPHLKWSIGALPITPKPKVFDDTAELLTAVCAVAQPDDHIVVMSNSKFDGMSQRIVERLFGKTQTSLQRDAGS